MLEAVRTARDRMIVTWLADSGMRIGELCGLCFCDLHLREGSSVRGAGRRRTCTSCGGGTRTEASAKTGPGRPGWSRAVVTGGTIRRASPAMVAAYHEYLIEDYHRLRALAGHDMVLVQLAGVRAGEPLTHAWCPADAGAGRAAGWAGPGDPACVPAYLGHAR